MFTCRLCDMRCNFLRATLVIINDVLPLLCSCKSTLNRFNPYPQTTYKLKNTKTKLHFVNKTHIHSHMKHSHGRAHFFLSLSLHTQWTYMECTTIYGTRDCNFLWCVCVPTILCESEKKHTDREIPRKRVEMWFQCVWREKERKKLPTNEPLHYLSYSSLFSYCHSNRFQSFNHFSPLHAWTRNELYKCLFLWTGISHYFSRCCCCLYVCKYTRLFILWFLEMHCTHTHTHTLTACHGKWLDIVPKGIQLSGMRVIVGKNEKMPWMPIDVHHSAEHSVRYIANSLSLKWICCM